MRALPTEIGAHRYDATRAGASRSTRARLCALAALLCTALVVAWPEARVVAKWLADPLVHATSAGAALTALLFVAASAMVLARPARPAGRRAQRRAATLLLAACACGAALNLGAHLRWLAQVDLPATLAIYQWEGADNSYSYLLHSHAGKTALADALAPLADPLALDVGQGLHAAMPWWVGAGCALALVLGLAAYLWLLPQVVARHRDSLGAGVLFALASLNGIKAIVDGGLLSYRCLPALLVAGFIALRPVDVPSRSRERLGLAAAIATLAAWIACWAAIETRGFGAAAWALLEFAALLVMIAAWAGPLWTAAAGERRRVGLRLAAFTCGAIVVANGYLRDALSGPGLLLRALADDYRAVYVDPVTLAAHNRPVGGRRPIDVYREFGEDPLKPRHVFLVRDAAHGGERSNFALAVIVQAAVDGQPTLPAPWRLETTFRDATERSDRRLLALDAGTPLLHGAFAAEGILAQNNYYCLLHGLAAQLRAAGMRRFTFAPLRDARDLQALLAHDARFEPQRVAVR